MLFAGGEGERHRRERVTAAARAPTNRTVRLPEPITYKLILLLDSDFSLNRTEIKFKLFY